MKRFYFLTCLLVIYLCSCSPVYYSPTTQNVPLLSHTGEYNVSLTQNLSTIELQGSVSPVHHLGLQLNGSYFIPQYMRNGDYGSGFMVDAGAGYYKSFGPLGHFVFETYAIGGVGSAHNVFIYRDSNATGGSISTNLARYGIQPIIGFKSKYFDAAFSSRLVGITFFDSRGSLVYNGTPQVSYLNEHRNSFLIEPAITLRAGSDFFKFQLQLQGSLNTTYRQFYQNNYMITLGIVISPNRYWNIFRKQVKPD